MGGAYLAFRLGVLLVQLVGEAGAGEAKLPLCKRSLAIHRARLCVDVLLGNLAAHLLLILQLDLRFVLVEASDLAAALVVGLDQRPVTRTGSSAVAAHVVGHLVEDGGWEAPQ